MEEVTLQEMLTKLVECILQNKERPKYFWKVEYEEGKPQFLEITNVDLLENRFKTSNDDFSLYEWELEESHIYKIPEEK